jgi:serine/threonine protein kinase
MAIDLLVGTSEVPRALSEALGERYRVEGLLGRGGMAVVYRAWDYKMSRWVAVKVLQPGLADSIKAERFMLEISITARLEHSCIVPVHERGEVGGLMFFTMRHFQDGSLRHRLERDRRLPIDEALAIARNMAQALDHAHAHGIVHRDIKPENILLDGGTGFVGDFGIARLLDVADRQQLTKTGMMIGTPQYMSPEQRTPGSLVDARSDVYSMACVVHEMLTGEAPFSEPLHRDVVNRDIGEASRELTVVRSTITRRMRKVISIALQNTAGDRYPSAGAFIRALEDAKRADEASSLLALARVAMQSNTFRRRLSLTAIAAAAVVLVAMTPPARALERRVLGALGLGAPADSMHLAILPFAYDSSAKLNLQERQFLGDALRRWNSVTIADEMKLSAVLRRHGAPGATDAQAVAADLHAGRFVRGDVSMVRDSVRVHAALYDTKTDSLIREGIVRIDSMHVGVDSAARDLADQLLFDVANPAWRLQCRTTRVSGAYRACIFAQASLAEWRLDTADSALAAAIERDPTFVHAHMWLAQVRTWRREPPARWRSAAEQAAVNRGVLSEVDQLRADALVALSRGEVRRSCALWETLVARTPDNYSGWYSLAVCLRGDHVVVRDRQSPSGWRFRSSYHRTLAAYRRAFLLQPSILNAFQADVFAGVRELFVTAPSALRDGQSLRPTSQQFLGRASWSSGDTLVMVPFPAAAVRAARPETRLSTTNDAVKRQRRQFMDIAVSWLSANPRSAAAMEGLSVALELLGDPAALDTLQRARAYATSDAERARIGIREVWLRLKFGVPGDEGAIRSARALADSLLSVPPRVAGRQTQFLAGLAALTGRATLAAELSRNAFGFSPTSTSAASVRYSGLSLLAFAALGGPSDSLRSHERQLRMAIETGLPDSEQGAARQEWLARSATLAFPDLPRDLRRGDDPLLDAQAAFAGGDEGAEARAYLANVRRARSGTDAASLSYDGIYPEAALLFALGDDAGAANWLDPVLRALPATAPLAVGDVAAAGSFVRSLVLRAELAARAGDRASARKWATAAAILWSDADAFLRPTVQRMQQLSR